MLTEWTLVPASDSTELTKEEKIRSITERLTTNLAHILQCRYFGLAKERSASEIGIELEEEAASLTVQLIRQDTSRYEHPPLRVSIGERIRSK